MVFQSDYNSAAQDFTLNDSNVLVTGRRTLDGDDPMLAYAQLHRVASTTQNTAPVAQNDTIVIQTNPSASTNGSINVTLNDSDVDNNLNVANVDLQPNVAGIQTTVVINNVTFSVNSDGLVTFTLPENFSGTISVPYAVSDDAGAVSNTATILVTGSLLTAIEEFESVLLYPNPTSSELKLQSKSSPFKELFIVNALGQVVESIPVSETSSQITLTVAHLPKGIYWVVYTTLQQQTRGKQAFVKN